MKRIKRLISLTLAIAVVLSGYTININAFANTVSNSQKSIKFITEENISDFQINDSSVKVIKEKDFKSLKSTELEYVIVDSNMLENEDVKFYLSDVYNHNGKIFVKGKDTTRNSVRKYFGLKEKEYPINKDISSSESTVENNNNEKMVDVSKFATIGMLIYKDGNINNVTQLSVELSNDENQVNKAIENCFGYDYLKLSGYESNESSALLQKNEAYASYTELWEQIDVDTTTWSTARGYVYTSIKLKENSGNPDQSGNYLIYVPYKLDVEMDAGFYIDKTIIEVKGGTGSLIDDYGPTPTSSSKTSFSFSLPYSLGVAFDVGTKVDVTKTSGGYDSNNLKLNYDVVTLVNAVDTQMHCEAHIESYQTSSSLKGSGQWHAYTCKYQFADPITYYNSTWDSVSGNSSY
nr:hypothetical protein [Sedimentibacter sp.]